MINKKMGRLWMLSKSESPGALYGTKLELPLFSKTNRAARRLQEREERRAERKASRKARKNK